MVIMKKYVGVRMVEAEPMLFAGAVNHGYYKSKAHFDILARGYHVRYSDGSDKWMPKEMFEKEFLIVENGCVPTEKDCKECIIKVRLADAKWKVESIMDHLRFVFQWAKFCC